MEIKIFMLFWNNFLDKINKSIHLRHLNIIFYFTALDIAICHNNIEMVRELLSRKDIDVNKKNIWIQRHL